MRYSPREQNKVMKKEELMQEPYSMKRKRRIDEYDIEFRKKLDLEDAREDDRHRKILEASLRTDDTPQRQKQLEQAEDERLGQFDENQRQRRKEHRRCHGQCNG